MGSPWRSTWGTIVKIIFNEILSLVYLIMTIEAIVLTLRLVSLLYQIILHCCLAKIQIQFICQTFTIVNKRRMGIYNLAYIVVYQINSTNIDSKSLDSWFLITKLFLWSRIILRWFDFSKIIESAFSTLLICTLHIFGITK